MTEQDILNIQRFSATQIYPKLLDLLGSLDDLHSQDDIEDIHDVRVASRRIRAALVVFNGHFPPKSIKAWDKSITAITKVFGRTRDLDVQIDFLENLIQTITVEERDIHPGLVRFYLRLVQQREKMASKVSKDREKFLEDKAILDLKETLESLLEGSQDAEHTDELFQLAFEMLHFSLDEFLFYEAYIYDPNNSRQLHQMRIVAKKLRYTMEIFLPLYDDEMEAYLEKMKGLQQKLGEIRDCDVWIESIPSFIQKEKKRTIEYYGNEDAMQKLQPGLDFLKQNRQEERDRLYSSFIEDWQNIREEKTWQSLHELILQKAICEQIQDSD